MPSRPNYDLRVLRQPLLWLLLAAVVAALSGSTDAMRHMVSGWAREEYNHSYLIPFIAAFLFWQRVPALLAARLAPSWLGLPVVLGAMAVMLLGELSALYAVVQYGFLAVLAGVVWATVGARGLLAVWAPMAYLLFMVPLPNFLYENLSQSLQLVSSAIGVGVIRLFGISVFLEGNVIDLGAYQLQVVEACSGLRYLFPLLSFGFLIACLFQGPAWQRVLIVASTVPITVLMNSFRIGVIGVLVEHWGIALAEGFLHYFEGWIIFVCCLAVLFLEIWVLHRCSRNAGSAWDRLHLGLPALSGLRLPEALHWRRQVPLAACVLALTAGAVATQGIGSRDEAVPQREPLLRFPLLYQGWLGREDHIDAPVIASLKLSDYFIANYRQPGDGLPVNLYIAFYDSQRKGASAHSPRSCLPGGGWVIERLDQVAVGPGLRVNRVVIAQGRQRQLVYYWFQQRGRVLTNEYLVKWYLFWDSLTRNRTDGALVRLVAPVPDGVRIEEPEALLGQFALDFHPLFDRFIPK